MKTGAPRFILLSALLVAFLFPGWATAQTASPATVSPLAEQHYKQGMLALQKGDLRTAIREFRLAVRYAPKLPTAHNSLGYAFLQNGQIDAAVTEFRKAIALGPTFTEAYLNMARALERRNDLDGAIQFCQYALRQRPDWANAHYQLGLALRAKGCHAEASAEFEKARELDPRLRPPRD
ncbi:MAG: tetratricopeptide repeat protein [Acidobacteriia bacterium]|nr:tetratricopeptide repeat protein [Terriglobia bacterium]